MIRSKRCSIFLFSLVATVVLFGSVSAGAQSLTAADILAAVDARGGIIGVGSQVAFLSFVVQDRIGSVQELSFVSFAKASADPLLPDFALVYFLAPPALPCGAMLLTIDRKITAQPTELYFFMFDQVKEITSTSERKGSFAGTNIQLDQIGRSELNANFIGELLGEAMLDVSVNGAVESRRVYVLHLTANPATSADESFPERTVWIDAEGFLVLAMESVNTVGKLQDVLRVNSVVTFEGRLEYSAMTVSNVLDNSRTTVTVTDREDLGDLPDSMFDPALLPQFDPRQFNDRLQVQVPDPICP